MTTTEETVKGFVLPSRKVKVKPIKRKGGWLPPGHEASFLFKGAYYELTVAVDARNRVVQPLTAAEQAFFEDRSKSGLDFGPGDLNANKRLTEDNFWLSKKARIRLKNEMTILDLSKPEDYLMYKILLTCKDTIAPSADLQFAKGTYKYVIVEEDHEVAEEMAKADAKLSAYTEFGAIRNNSKKLRYVLMVVGAKKVARDTELKFLQAEVAKIVEANPNKFVAAVLDKDLEAKILIQEAVVAKALKKEGTVYMLPSGDKIGNNIAEAVEFLNSKKNQEHRVVIESRVEQFMSE